VSAVLRIKESNVTQAQSGDKVQVHYTGRLQDGTVFDSSQGREPFEFTIGKRQVIPGFEEAVIGLEPGESTTTDIPVHKAYGPRDDRLVMHVNRAQIPSEVDIALNARLELRRRDGGTFVVTVTEITDDDVSLDANHPLAGQDLQFDIELVGIE
jgi:peptidylprolyl isomerase